MTKPRRKPITEEQLSGWSMLAKFCGLLEKHGGRIAPNRWERHGLRELDRHTYFGLFLFGLFNPVVDSMRALCSETRLKRVQQVFEREGPMHIAVFSDAQRVFDPEILEPVMRGLLAKCLAACGIAPVCMVNDDFHEGIAADRAEALLNTYAP